MLLRCVWRVPLLLLLHAELSAPLHLGSACGLPRAAIDARRSYTVVPKCRCFQINREQNHLSKIVCAATCMQVMA